MRHRLFLLLLCVLSACGKKEEQSKTGSSATLNLNKEIIAKPASLISVTSPIILEFRSDIVPEHLVTTQLNKNPLEFTPDINGTVEWTSRHSLRFTPKENLPAGQKYKGVFRGRLALGPQSNLGDYDFAFKTMEQEVLGLEGDFEAEGEKANAVLFKGTLRLAQAADETNFKKKLNITLDGKDIACELQKQGRDFQLKCKGMTRQDKAQILVFKLPKEYCVECKEWKREFFLESRNVFRVLSQMELSDPSSSKFSYGFRFSDPVASSEDLSGYVILEPSAKFKARSDGKTLRLEGHFIPGMKYSVRLLQGLPSAYATKLASEWLGSFVLENRMPNIKWLSDGSYLVPGQNFHLQIESMNVARVDLEVIEIFPSNIGFLLQSNNAWKRSTSQQNGDDGYEDEYYGSNRGYQELDRVGNTILKKQYNLNAVPNQMRKTELDLSEAVKGKRRSIFVIKLQYNSTMLTLPCTNDQNEAGEGKLYYQNENWYQNPCSDGGFYYKNGSVERMLIQSDVALTAKRSEKSWRVFASHIPSTKPMGGFELNLYSYQNQILVISRTDADGYAEFPAEDDRGYIAGRSDDGLALLELDQPAWELSSFGTEGLVSSPSGWDAFFYSERGVHRPGDTIHLCAMIRQDRKLPPNDLPVLVKFKDPGGRLSWEGRTKAGSGGHFCLELQTQAQDPTGTWQAEFKIGGQLLSHSLRIEAVRPNRLKVKLNTPELLNVTQAKDRSMPLEGSLHADWLFGSPGADLQTRIRGQLVHRALDYPRWKDFVFAHPLGHFNLKELEVFEGQLDKQGDANFKTELKGLDDAVEALSLGLSATVEEKGGGATRGGKIIPINPYTSYVGIKAKLPQWSVRQGDDYHLEIVCIDDKGNPVAGKNLKLSLKVNRRWWWWHYGKDGRKNFQTNSNTYTVLEQSLRSGTEAIKWKLHPEDEGQHLLEILDEESGHVTGVFFYSSQWGSGAAASQVQNPQPFLQISADKNAYGPGDQALLRFESPSEGHALFTLEQGQKLLEWRWVPIKKGQTELKVKLGEALIPNAYASISLIQPHGQNKNDMPIRLYGVKPLFVEDPLTHLDMSLDLPDTLKPDADFEINIRSQSPNSSMATFALVDDGLLDLTDFATPDPWKYYHQKRGLTLRTIDNYEDIANALTASPDELLRIGGDLEALRKRAGASKNNRFPPVVLFKGPFEVKANSSIRFKLHMPNYSGSVRAMLVASSEKSFVSKEKTIPVRQDLMILSSAPRVLRPGDKIKLPVTVFVTRKKESGQAVTVKVQITVEKGLKIVGNSEKEISVSQPGEEELTFELEANGKTEESVIHLRADGDGMRAVENTTIPIVSANPYMVVSSDTILNAGEKIEYRLTPNGPRDSSWILASKAQGFNAQSMVQDLLHYPYGCLEQTISSAFAQLRLHQLADLRSDQKQAATDHVNIAISRLPSFTVGSEPWGFFLWPRRSSANNRDDWASTYAAHFMVEAKSLGYQIPDELQKDALKSLHRKAKDISAQNHRYQCYRLFSLALAGEPEKGAMNVLRENYLQDLDPLSQSLLAASYAISGEKEATQKILAAKPKIDAALQKDEWHEMSGTYGSAFRDLAFQCYLALKIGDQTLSSRLMSSLSKASMKRNWYSTQESAFALLALSEWIKTRTSNDGESEIELISPDGKKRKERVNQKQLRLDNTAYLGKSITIKNLGPGQVYLSNVLAGVPIEPIYGDKSEGLVLERKFYDEDGRPLKMGQLRRGIPFWIHYQVASRFSETAENIALSSPLPSGWEMINPRMSADQVPEWLRSLQASYGTYMDVRDDRVNWFFDLYYQRKLNFVIKVLPQGVGEFQIPPVRVEAMYRPDLSAHIGADKIQME